MRDWHPPLASLQACVNCGLHVNVVRFGGFCCIGNSLLLVVGLSLQHGIDGTMAVYRADDATQPCSALFLQPLRSCTTFLLRRLHPAVEKAARPQPSQTAQQGMTLALTSGLRELATSQRVIFSA
jgi:hypothetical protein